PEISRFLIPINDKIKGKDISINEVTNARDNIMNIIQKNIKIVYPKTNEEFVLQTDSSNKCCSGILTQKHGILGVFSHKFTDTEFKYSIVEKEFLGILLSLNKFKNL